MSSQPGNEDQERPPVFGSWKRWYIFILLILAIQILLYGWLTLSYR